MGGGGFEEGQAVLPPVARDADQEPGRPFYGDAHGAHVGRRQPFHVYPPGRHRGERLLYMWCFANIFGRVGFFVVYFLYI